METGNVSFRRALGFVKGDVTRVALYVLLLLVMAAATVAPALLFGKIIDAGLRAGDPDVISRLGLLAVGLAGLTALLMFASQWLSAAVAEGITMRARVRVFDHVRQLPVSFSQHSDTGALVSRVLNDVTGIQVITQTLATVLSNLVTAVVVFAAIVAMDWHIALFAVGMFPLFLVPGRWAMTHMTLQHRTRMDRAAALATATSELLSPAGALLSRLQSRPARDSAAFRETATGLRDAGVRLSLLNGMFLACLGLMAAGGTAGVFWLGSLAMTMGTLTAGGLVTVATLTGQLYGALTQLASSPVNLTAARVSLNRVCEVLDLPAPPEGTAALPDGSGEVELRAVSFRYPTPGEATLPSLRGGATPSALRHSEVLKDLSLRLAPATTTALVGATGAGKTTVALLVAGVYAPTTGRVLLDGCDVTRLRTEDRLRAIGVVTQDAHLVHASIRTNLLLACPDASPASLVEAVAAAGLEEFIHSLPDGYDTIVGVNGVRLSGGQRQRLSLARVLLQSPRVVVLDEATAHLDVETETLVRARLRERLRGRTTLVVAHRLSTVLDADQVAVLKEGRLCELGHPGELLRRGGAFSRLCTAAGLDVTAAQPPEQQGNSTLGIRAQDISAASDDQSVAGSAPGHAT